MTDAPKTATSETSTKPSMRNPIKHALTVYYDGNAELAESILSIYESEIRGSDAPAADLKHPADRNL